MLVNLKARLVSFARRWRKDNQYDSIVPTKQEDRAREDEVLVTDQLGQHGNGSSAASHEAENAVFWWFAIAPVLQTLMQHAGYSVESSERALKDFDDVVAGNLGPSPGPDGRPIRWRSFMTDDFTPIELSWSWGILSEAAVPKVRYSIEPVGQQAGLISDPWNMKASTQLIDRLSKRFSQLDRVVYDKLVTKVAKLTAQSPIFQGSDQSASPSSMFVAFELEAAEPMIKTYMLPFRWLATSQKSCSDLTLEFVDSFAHEQNWTSLMDLLRVLGDDEYQNVIQPFMIAFDCVPLQQTRMKIYVRAADTSFNTVCRIMSLFKDSHEIGNALEELKELWKLLFDLDSDFDLDIPLRHRDHETAGILFYLEVRPTSTHVTSKVYIPVKHYAASDLSAATAMVSFMKSKRGPGYHTADSYLSALQKICTHRRLEDGSGLQTYVSCAIKSGTLDITSYINPEVYHQSRHKNQDVI